MASEDMSFSVIVPLYNKAAYIRRCLESVLCQTGVRFEIVVVDDGSTDNGAAIVEGMGDSRIRVVRQENLGAAAARNRGATLARHELLTFLDADDEWEPQFLSAMSDLIRHYPQAQLYAAGFITYNGTGIVQCYCGRLGPAPVVSKEGGLSSPPSPNWRAGKPALLSIMSSARSEQSLLDVFAEWVHAPAFNASSVVARRDGFHSVGGFPEELRYNEDWVFFFQMAVRYPVAYCRRPLVRYHTDISSQATQSLAHNLPGVLPYVRWLDEMYERHCAGKSFARFCRHAYRWTLFACIRRFGRARLTDNIQGLHVARILPVEGFLLRQRWYLGVYVWVTFRYYLPHVLTHGRKFGVRRLDAAFPNHGFH